MSSLSILDRQRSVVWRDDTLIDKPGDLYKMPKDIANDTDKQYPHLSHWVSSRGWIEIGVEYRGHLFARGLDEGGLIWEGDGYQTLDAAMQALEQGIAEWTQKNL